MGETVKLKMPPSLLGRGAIGELVSRKNDILLEGGKAIHECIADWYRGKASKNGFFNSEDIHEPIVHGDSVSVPIFTPGISRAYHDLDIYPREAKMLAIPLHASAYGMQPREWNTAHPKGTPNELFLIKSDAGNPILVRNDRRRRHKGELIAMYYLTPHVHQKQDRSLLPPDISMEQAFKEAVHEAIGLFTNRTIVQK